MTEDQKPPVQPKQQKLLNFTRVPSNIMTVGKLIEALEKKFGRDSELEVVDSLGNNINRIKLVATPESLGKLDSFSTWEQSQGDSDIWSARVTGVLQITSNETMAFIANGFEHLEEDEPDIAG